MKSVLKITPNCVVSLTWTLKDTLGDVLDELDEAVEFLVGGHDLLAKIEEAFQGHEAGSTLDLHLEPEDAFGEYDEMRIYLQARNLFPAELESGMTFDGAALPAGSSTEIDPQLIYTVTDIYPEHVVLDGNHPLAGIAIRLSLKVEAVREATNEERTNGSVGAGFFRLAPSSPGNGTVH